jgi:hypothetical protein
MMESRRSARVQAAVLTLAEGRSAARSLLAADVGTSDSDAHNNARTFPRSKTFRWLLTHPAGRWLGSAVLTGALYQLPFGRTVGAFLQSAKRSASAKK